MGDAGEGLVDAQARIQERTEEVERERRERQSGRPANAATLKERESLELARTELRRQFEHTVDERRRASISQALVELERRISNISAKA
jgi:hypothetical protein